MNILEKILGVSGVGQLVKDVVGTFKLSPEQKLEFEKQIVENEFQLKKIDAELESRLADAASANIRAEASSGDKFTSRARPTFLYIMNFILLWNYVAVPIFKQTPVALPEEMFWLFGSCMLGYTGARTWEKITERRTNGNGKHHVATTSPTSTLARAAGL